MFESAPRSPSWRRAAAAGLATALFAITAAAFLAAKTARGSKEKIVHVESPDWWSLTGDQTPVRTELYYYPYDRQNSDVVSGKPLTFVFPKAAYVYRENQAGGPQKSITLAIDRRTFGPLVNSIQPLVSADVSLSMLYNRFKKHDLLIRVESNRESSYIPFRKDGFKKEVARGDVKPIGKVCGFEVGYRHNSATMPERSPVIIEGIDLDALDVSGVTVDPLAKSISLECLAGVPQCRVSTQIEGRGVTYYIPKENVCEHARTTDKVLHLLREHQVK